MRSDFKMVKSRVCIQVYRPDLASKTPNFPPFGLMSTRNIALFSHSNWVILLPLPNYYAKNSSDWALAIPLYQR
ncbi:MAG: hypothetical protein KatS3mg087_1837 [Patescibacteria group bacterium]|nr:MAG: hypothetical protein KatS3mg087_1837 [Patescibacteria group bacterium]